MSKIAADIGRTLNKLKTVPQQFADKFKSVTPKKSGRARNNTKLSGDTVNADYNYAGPLNKGSSRQAPQGMTAPTIKYIRQVVGKILGT
jgi:hypothetical protein